MPANFKIFAHTPNISYDPIHTKNNYVKKGYLQTQKSLWPPYIKKLKKDTYKPQIFL